MPFVLPLKLSHATAENCQNGSFAYLPKVAFCDLRQLQIPPTGIWSPKTSVAFVACFLSIWTPTPQNTATNLSERISRFPLGSTPLPKPKGSMSLKFCSKHSPRSTKRKPLWFELIQGCRNSRPPFQNHSPESGYRFLITKGRHDSLPLSLHRPKLDNETLLRFSHTAPSVVDSPRFAV
nr:MAG TPA: hypothetical protein [Caudoviricetes sp.]